MPNVWSTLAVASVAERVAGELLLRTAADTPRRVLTTSFLQPDATGMINGTGVARLGDIDAVSGGVWAAPRYIAGQWPHAFGGMYSSGELLIGFGVRSSTAAANTFLSTIDNASWKRGALVLGAGLSFYNAAAQATAVGSAVTMTARFQIDESGNVGIGTTPSAARLDINGNVRTTVGSGGFLLLHETDPTRANQLSAGADASGSYLNASFSAGGSPVLRIQTANVERVRVDASALSPGTDNAITNGAAAKRWSVVYAATGTINTSDERAKHDIGAIPDGWLDAWSLVQWSRFKFIDGSRWHLGLIAQDVYEAFAAHGLDAFEIGLCCYDEWEEQREPIYETVTRTVQVERAAQPEQVGVDNEGNPILQPRFVMVEEEITEQVSTGETRVIQEAGNRWGLRYDECQAIEAAWQRRKIDALEARLSMLEGR